MTKTQPTPVNYIENFEYLQQEPKTPYIPEGEITEARAARSITRSLNEKVNASGVQSSVHVDGVTTWGNEILMTVTEANGEVKHFKVTVEAWHF